MNRYFFAIDIGASSGRHMLSWMEEGKMMLREMYRFENRQKEKDGHLCWDLDNLWEGVTEGLKACKKEGMIPETIGIDTWAVDFVLLDGEDKLIGDVVAYRDDRTKGMDREVFELIPERELYERTGIQKQPFNTIYQLMAVKKQAPQDLEKAETFLMLPDYLNFRLTGVKKQEYTNATSTNLVNVADKTWDQEIIRKLGIPERLFGELSVPGTIVGPLRHELEEKVGFSATVVLPATHDTGSAFLSVPARDESSVYLSSGTWSLLGVENLEPITSQDAQKANLTNEGGAFYRYRFLKNIMGLWIIQSIRRELNGTEYVEGRKSKYATGKNYSFPDLIQEAGNTVGEIMQCVYKGLSKCYADTVKQISEITGKEITAVNIIGGGCQDAYLNELTARATGLPVFAGPIEGTAIGNLVIQMINAGIFKDLAEARDCIYRSFDVKEFR